MKKSEFELIGRIRRMFPSKPGITGIGDDAAVIEDGFLVTTDALCDGTHFLSNRVHFRDLGYKSLAVNVSDIAAMGGRPLHALLTVGLTKKTSDKQIEDLLAGIKKCSKEFGFDLIGGDTVRSENLFISVTLFGKPIKKPVLRSGAKKGDFVYVSGTLGDSAIGLDLLLKRNNCPVKDHAYFIKRHDLPQPRVRLMEFLVKNYDIRSCIDCSDGFLADLGHICEMSGTGFRVDAGNLPVSVEKIGKSYRNGRKYFIGLAAGGGEDYELIFTSPDRLDGDEIRKKTGIQVTQAGLITGNRGRFEVVLDGKTLKPGELKSGFSHF